MDNINTKNSEIKLNEELDNYQKQTEEYLNNWKRERADFLNYKKEESRRLEEFVKYANEDLILEIIDLLDDLEIVAKEVPGVGLENVVKRFNELFKKYGVERIETEGKKFNPELHEAIEIARSRQAEGEAGEKDLPAQAGGEKMVEVRAGYTMHGKVVRPARVKLIK